MQTFANLLLYILFFYGVYKGIKALSRNENRIENSIHKTSNPSSIIKVHSNRHGHRCYMEEFDSEYEMKVANLLANSLDHNKYFIFNNILLPSSVTTTSQIDHVVISKYGIFVIETKDINGWIFTSNNSQWTQTLPNKYHKRNRGSETHFRYPVTNPLSQNYAHVMALREQLPFIKKGFFDVVVFSDNAIFKPHRPEKVLSENGLIDFIDSKQELLLKEVELLLVIGKLSMLCQVTETTSTEHKQNINNYLETKSARTNSNLVPVRAT